MYICGKYFQVRKDKTQQRFVVHLQIGDEHRYYGSIKSLCENNSHDKIGVSYNTLRCFGIKEEKPYINKHCIIRKGRLLTQKSNRGRKKNEDGNNE